MLQSILFCSYLASGGHFTFQQWIGVTQPRPRKHWRLKRTEIVVKVIQEWAEWCTSRTSGSNPSRTTTWICFSVVPSSNHGPPFLRGHLSHIMVSPSEGQSQNLHFSVILGSRILVCPGDRTRDFPLSSQASPAAVADKTFKQNNKNRMRGQTLMPTYPDGCRGVSRWGSVCSCKG